jgi:hypothetical protein
MRSFTTFRMTKIGKLTIILKRSSISAETVPKINIVILSKAKNLLFFFSSQKSKEEILWPYGLGITRKGKLTGILEQS